MNPFQLLSAIGFPLVMAIGGIAAWRLTKKEAKRESEPAQWRDDSLDEWMKERDAKVDATRQARLSGKDLSGKDLSGAGSEEEVTVRHQRIGG